MSTDTTETPVADLSDAINLIHQHPADILRLLPGRWARVSEHARHRTAATVAKAIREAQYPAWAPAGHYETTTRADGDDHVVFARYVGEDGQS